MTNWLWLGFFSAFWLLPLAARGLLHRSVWYAPPVVDRMANAFCLFSRSQDYFPLQYIEVLVPGSAVWTTVDQTEFFSMSPFGGRNRFDEMLRKGLANERSLDELAGFVRWRHWTRTRVLPVGVRFVAGVSLPSECPVGPFVRPQLSEIPVTRREVWFARTYPEIPPSSLRQDP